MWRLAFRALVTTVRPALEEIGRNIGNAIGERVGRRLDPEGAAERAERAEPDEEEDD